MSVAVVGISHRTAPVEIRERLAFSRSEIPTVLARVVGSGASSEAVLLSTCNRTELYFSAADERAGEAAARALLAEQWQEPQPISTYLYAHRGRAAVDHLFRVTSGISGSNSATKSLSRPANGSSNSTSSRSRTGRSRG